MAGSSAQRWEKINPIKAVDLAGVRHGLFSPRHCFCRLDGAQRGAKGEFGRRIAKNSH
jgi:hypothetical protein